MGMIETYSRGIRLSELFPPDDPVSALVAHLCVLKEDFHLEYRGIAQEGGIEELDQNTAAWRRTYFSRTLLRTLYEILRVSGIAQGNHEVRESLERKPQRLQTAFKQLVSVMEPERDFIDSLRNRIGGHLDYLTVRTAINTIDHSRHGVIQVGATLGHTHYFFVNELVVAILLAGIPVEKQQQELDHINKRITDVMKSLLPAIDEIFYAYLDDQGFLTTR